MKGYRMTPTSQDHKLAASEWNDSVAGDFLWTNSNFCEAIAAIVARELGIPAVVGCGNATMRLHTGDRVRVNGGQGRVEILKERSL